MSRIIVTGCGTDVGKTVASTILTLASGGDYWKPVECGGSDTEWVKKWVGTNRVHSPCYRWKAPLSPHHAARLEEGRVDVKQVKLPCTNNTLVIETAGGIYVPLNEYTLALDLFSSWEAKWVVVSRHYVGSINHTLLTLEILKSKGILPTFLIFNGEPNPDSERVILHFSGIDRFLRLLPEQELTFQTLARYGALWNRQL